LWPEAMWNYTYLEHKTDMPDLSEIYKLYQTKDGWVMVYAVATQAHWTNTCAVLGRDDLASDPRFADLQGRVRFGALLNAELEAETKQRTTAEMIELMDKADVPVAPVNSREAMVVDPHLRHRGVFVESEHPAVGPIRQIRPPARYSKTPIGIRRHAPAFGEHSDEILRDILGRSPDEIRELREAGVVF